MPDSKPEYYVGVMSGTSLDGIDVVIARFGESAEVISEYSTKFDPAFRAIIMEIATSDTISVDLFVRSHFVLAHAYAAAVEASIEASALPRHLIRAIGLHGQTVRHLPIPATLTPKTAETGATFQLGSGAALAALLGIDVVSDFRSADVALGGEGAPLVPMFDFAFLKSETVNRICLNIGGIANLTFLPASAEPEDVIAFDSGPGNMVIDSLADQYFGVPFDSGGRIAASGKSDPALLSDLLLAPYLLAPPPKSTGREQFGERVLRVFREKIAAGSLSVEDAVATATELTARSIVKSFEFLPLGNSGLQMSELIISGGGGKKCTSLPAYR